MRKIGWLFFLCALSGFAEETLVDSLRGILILGDWDLMEKESFEEIHGVESRGVALLEENGYVLEKLASDYIGKPLTKESFCEIKDRIASFYKEMNQPFAVIKIPKQKISNGVLPVVVEEAKLGEIRSKGNKYYTGTELMGYIRTKGGDPIVMKSLVEDVAWMNQNPFRRTDAVIVPGKKPGTADLELVTDDRWPYRIYVGADNTGTIATERDRFFFGFNFGKTLLKDADVSYQFTFSPNWNRFYAHTASTRVPCPWRHTFVFWGGYSQVEPSIEGHQKECGTSWQVDGRYRIPIFEAPTVMQELVIGYDFKETSNQVKSGRTTIFDETVDINQFMLGYELGSRNKEQRVTLVAEAYANPTGLTDKNKKRQYEKFRFDAGPLYAYLKVAHSYARKVKGWWFSYDLSGQISSKNLLPSEQFNLTGYSAVRGFEERVLLVDDAALLNVALETPHWSPAKWCGSRKAVDELYFLGFFDCGFGCNRQRAPGEKKFKSLGSIGPGIRYQFSRYVTGRLDYGFQLWHKGFFNPSHSRYNFGLIVSY